MNNIIKFFYFIVATAIVAVAGFHMSINNECSFEGMKKANTEVLASGEANKPKEPSPCQMGNPDTWGTMTPDTFLNDKEYYESEGYVYDFFCGDCIMNVFKNIEDWNCPR